MIKIGQHAPRSERDFFVLNLARAQCDAVLTTAQVIRAEPRLSHTLQGPLAAELAKYREDVLGKREPPVCAILTRSGELQPEHPVFSDPLRKVVLTLNANVAPLRAALAGRAEVIGFAELQARDAVDWLNDQGARGISVEAGPSTAGRLYDAPSRVQQLRLSIFEGEIHPAAIGGALPADEQLFAGLRCASETRFEEPSGPWRFQCWDPLGQ